MLIYHTSGSWKFKYQEPEFYARLFDEWEEGPFDVPPGCTNVGVLIKSVPGAHKLYVLQEINSACVIFWFLCDFFFVGDKFAADFFKDDIIPSLKAEYMLKLSQDVSINHVRYKGGNNTNYHIKYLINNMYMLHCFKYPCLQH